jgi:CO/xanthine dehydrogenase FAD-binding subunit
MKNFTYYQPGTADAVVGLLDGTWGKTEILGGGTDLLDLQKEYVAQPDKVVSITAIKDLSGIKIEKGSVTIGAATKLAEIAEHSELRKLFPCADDGVWRDRWTADSQHGHHRRQSGATQPLLVLP